MKTANTSSEKVTHFKHECLYTNAELTHEGVQGALIPLHSAVLKSRILWLPLCCVILRYNSVCYVVYGKETWSFTTRGKHRLGNR
jgi:hypothetical protein